jgi:hypothetical protein
MLSFTFKFGGTYGYQEALKDKTCLRRIWHHCTFGVIKNKLKIASKPLTSVNTTANYKSTFWITWVSL